MGARAEEKVSGCSRSARISDNTVWDALGFLNRSLKITAKNNMEINWAAETKRNALAGRRLNEQELDCVAGLLSSDSVTAVGLAKEIITICLKTQKEEAMERLEKVLSHGSKRQKINAISVMEMAGDSSTLPLVASTLHEFEKAERARIERIMGRIAERRPEGLDLGALGKELRAQAGKMAARGEPHAAAEMRECLRMIKRAAGSVGMPERRMRRKRKPARPASIRQKAASY